MGEEIVSGFDEVRSGYGEFEERRWCYREREDVVGKDRDIKNIFFFLNCFICNRYLNIIGWINKWILLRIGFFLKMCFIIRFVIEGFFNFFEGMVFK